MAPQISREVGAGILDALILADQAAELAADLLGARFLRRVAHHLRRVADGISGDGDQQQKQQGGETTRHASARQAGCNRCSIVSRVQRAGPVPAHDALAVHEEGLRHARDAPVDRHPPRLVPRDAGKRVCRADWMNCVILSGVSL